VCSSDLGKAALGPCALTGRVLLHAAALSLALGTLYLLYNPENYTSLTVDFGWSDKRYETWLAEMLYRTLLA